MDFAIKATNITKTFPGVRALTDVSIEIVAGETHSVVGENGARITGHGTARVFRAGAV